MLAFTGLLYVLHSELSTCHSPLLSAGSTDLGHSTGVTSAVFFAGLLAGAAKLAGPAGALSVARYLCLCRDSMSEYKEPTYDCPLQLDENPAYEVMQK